jgi:hypothetical protein
VILAHHMGEEMLIPALASGGSMIGMLVFSARSKLAELRRWILRR